MDVVYNAVAQGPALDYMRVTIPVSMPAGGADPVGLAAEACSLD
jgi:hypothetical protein